MSFNTSSSARRDAARRARDAFPPMGVYLIRNRETGQVVVASSRNVYGAINRIRFELRLGSHPDKALQAQWDHGHPGQFDFDVVELLQEREGAGIDYAAELCMLEQLYREQYEQQRAASL